MKKTILIIMILLMTFTKCSCEKFINSDKIGREHSKEILEYFSDDNEEGLKEMFCNKTAERDTFEEEIKDAMDFFQGEIISYDSLIGKSGGGYIVRDGKTVKLSIRPLITNVETEAGKTYNIKFYSYLIYAEDADVVGISQLSITDIETEEEFKIGEYIK